MSYTLELKLFKKKTGELFAQVTVGNLLGRDLDVSILNPDINTTVIRNRVVISSSASNRITNLYSLPWDGKQFAVKVILNDEYNLLCSETSASNNSGDAIHEPEG